jgi:membrane associated rhomboid family serine protease
VLQVLIFVINLIVGGGFAKPSVNPMLGPSTESLILFGANYQPLTRNEGEVWRLVVPIFLHAGVIHLLLNLFIQWKIGFPLERVWGWWRIIPIYILSGIVGNEYSAIFNQSPSVGASGKLLDFIIEY